MRKLYLILLLCLSATIAFSQDSKCGQTLRLAQSIYDQGRLHELEPIINRALSDTGNPCFLADQVSLLKLLTLTYIYLEEPAKADDSMLKLLEADHYFELNPAVDPAEFVALYNTFRTKPIYRIGAKLGVNASRANVTNSVTSVELASGSEFKYAFAILFGGAVDVPIHFKNKNDDNFTLHGELLYWQKKFEIDQKVDRDTDGDPLTNALQGFETQNWLSLPLSLEYRFLDKKYNPYVAGGVAIDYLLSGKLRTQRLRDDVTSIQEATYDVKGQRNPINISALIAAGVKIKMAGGFFVTEVRYVHGITNVNSTETVYNNEFAVWNQGYPDSIYKISSLAISGTYVINVFNPKKKKL